METDDMDKTPDRTKHWAARMCARKPPQVALDLNDQNVLSINLDGEWSGILRAAGNVAVGDGIIGHAARLGAEGQKINADASNFVLGFVDAMDPRDPAEILLLSQMAATHQAVMMLARHLNHTKTVQQIDCAEKALNKTARTFTAQMETLKRYRSKGQQVVRVERVTVEAGAQAVVGNVERGRGTDET